MTIFRPCIDLHNGQVKQIVGGSLNDNDQQSLKTNYVSEHDSAWFAKQYQQDQLSGGHIIKLGPGNDQAAQQALAAWPDGMHIGGGINADNAQTWLDAGAEKVIVTSYVFDGAQLNVAALEQLSARIGKEHLVVDLSCRRRDDTWVVATNRWQTYTNFEITASNLQLVSDYCSELLVHAADVEGKCQGIDTELVSYLGQHLTIPCTYAGGANNISDLSNVEQLSNGKIDLTFGSALDLFGGTSVAYQDCVAWNKAK